MKPKPLWYRTTIIVLVILVIYVGSYFVLTDKSTSPAPIAGHAPSTDRFVKYKWMPSWVIEPYRPLIAIEGFLTGETIDVAYLIQ